MSAANPLSVRSIDSPGDTLDSLADTDRSEILIFAKAPRCGHCKTRLARGLGHIRATRIYRGLLHHAVQQAAAAQPDRITLVCSPDTSHPLFQRLARRHGVQLRRQARGSLGRRMHRAFAAASRRSAPVILMGSDQPESLAPLLTEGLQSLRAGHAWLAPTRDGGYWSIGVSCPDSRIFHGPAWSTPRVAPHTRTIMARVGQAPASPYHQCDIDGPLDWYRLEPRLRARIARYAAMPGLIRRDQPAEEEPSLAVRNRR